MDAASRVALNTIILYGRMVVTIGISLYSTRLILNALGSIDYGIYNLVAGVIVMLSFLNTAMATSSQRYLSYYQGSNDLLLQKKIFTNSFFLHLLIGISVVFILEIIGLFLFNGEILNIPLNRMDTARLIYHYMALTVFFTVMTVPFNGLLIAHENMWWVALINVLETLLKLGIALLLYVVASDKLAVYGMLTASISIVSFGGYMWYCLKNYSECTLKDVLRPEGTLVKEIGSFAGWNMFGALCGIGRNEGLALVLNFFFGTVVNAAYGIANQVSSQLLFFSRTMLRALNPQIMKSEGAGNRERMLRLSMMASKFGFFLLSIFAVPIVFEMPGILTFWLKNVPDHTVDFCRLVLFAALLNQLTIGVQSALQAHGDIKLYQMVVGGVLLLNLPLAYFMLKYGDFPPSVVLVSYAFIELFGCMLRLIIARIKINLSLRIYFKEVIAKLFFPLVILILVNCLMIGIVDVKFRFIWTCFISFLVYGLLIFFFGCNDKEKELIYRGINKLKR